jgi:hypothetical protein
MKVRALCLALLLPASALAQAPPAAPDPKAPAAAAASPEPVPEQRARLAFTSTSAFGVSNARFFNELLGARFDYRFTRRFALGGALAYANLKGKDGRTHNALPEAMLEYRIPITGDAFGMPLRFAAGFLPKNGPTLRLGAGLDYAFSDTVSVEVVPLEPMVWVTRERPEVSFNLSLALRVAL